MGQKKRLMQVGDSKMNNENLAKCYQCGGIVSKDSERCPHCGGYTTEDKKKIAGLQSQIDVFKDQSKPKGDEYLGCATILFIVVLVAYWIWLL